MTQKREVIHRRLLSKAVETAAPWPQAVRSGGVRKSGCDFQSPGTLRNGTHAEKAGVVASRRPGDTIHKPGLANCWIFSYVSRQEIGESPNFLRNNSGSMP